MFVHAAIGAGEALMLVVPAKGNPCTSLLLPPFFTKAARVDGALSHTLSWPSCLGKPELPWDLMLFACGCLSLSNLHHSFCEL